MAQRPVSTEEQYPEVVEVAPRTPAGFNVFDSSWEHYEVEDAPAVEDRPTTPHSPHMTPAPEYSQQRASTPSFLPQRSPAPSYQPYSPGRSIPSPRLSSSSPPPLSQSGLGLTHSPSISEGTWKHSISARPVVYSEFNSPDPETVPVQHVQQYGRYQNEKAAPSEDPEAVFAVRDEKEAIGKGGVTVTETLAPSHTVKRKPLPPQPIAEESVHQQKKNPIYKRPLWIILGVLAVIIVVAAAVVGGVIGSRKSSGGSTPDNTITITGDPTLAIGGSLNPTWYSKSGAFNGSGVAIAAANPGVDRTTYVFYQDYQGAINYKLMDNEGRAQVLPGPIHNTNYKPLNGTALSIVNHSPRSGNQVYHLFYLDQNLIVRERILETSPSNNGGAVIPSWKDGPINDLNIKSLNSTSIGMQACFYNDYYGNYNNNSKYATDAIQFWVALNETRFAQYSWVNGTSPWKFDQYWDNLNAHAGVGCQTWDSWIYEYVFFVDLNQNIVAYWKDNNRTAPSTATHPTLKWTKIQNISIPNAHRSTSLGYTTYMLYQASDHSIRGANITWNVENSTIAQSTTTGMPDIFTIDDRSSNDAVFVLGGSHLSITAVKTSSGGAELQVYLQQNGTDITQYTRDLNQVNGKWGAGANVV